MTITAKEALEAFHKSHAFTAKINTCCDMAEHNRKDGDLRGEKMHLDKADELLDLKFAAVNTVTAYLTQQAESEKEKANASPA